MANDKKDKADVKETSPDIEKYLLEQRKIFISADIDQKIALDIVKKIHYLNGIDSKKDISIYICTYGGLIYSGFDIIDAMNTSKCDIRTYVSGISASMGAVISVNGTKGKRFAYPNARFMIHQPSSALPRMKETDLKDHSAELTYLRKQLVQHLARGTGKTIKQIDSDFENDFFMSAQEAKKYGLIDSITNNL